MTPDSDPADFFDLIRALCSAPFGRLRFAVDLVYMVAVILFCSGWTLSVGYLYWVAEEGLPPWKEHMCTVEDKVYKNYDKQKNKDDDVLSKEYHTELHLSWLDNGVKHSGIDRRCSRWQGESPDDTAKFRCESKCTDDASCDCWCWLNIGDTWECYHDEALGGARVRKTTQGIEPAVQFFWALIAVAGAIVLFGLVAPCFDFVTRRVKFCARRQFGCVASPHVTWITTSLTIATTVTIFGAILPWFFVALRSMAEPVTMLLFTFFVCCLVVLLPCAVLWHTIIGMWHVAVEETCHAFCLRPYIISIFSWSALLSSTSKANLKDPKGVAKMFGNSFDEEEVVNERKKDWRWYSARAWSVNNQEIKTYPCHDVELGTAPVLAMQSVGENTTIIPVNVATIQ